MDKEFKKFLTDKINFLCQGKQDTDENFVSLNAKFDLLVIRVDKADTEIASQKIENNNLREQLDKLSKRIAENEEVTKNLKTEYNTSKIKIEELEEHLIIQERKYTNKLEDLENRQRRNNLVISGLKQKTGETWADTEQIVLSFLKETLGVEVSIQRAHRLGIDKGKIRPVIVLLDNFKDKERIMSKAKLLKGTGQYINEDFSFHTRLARSELLQFVKKFHEGKRFRLVYNALFVENRKFAYGENGVYEVSNYKVTKE